MDQHEGGVKRRKLFEGIKVLAITRQVAAPFATYHLALHGADVLTIEKPGEPDSMRFVGADRMPLAKRGMSPSFLAQGSNKRSMSLNIASPQGQAIFRKLALDTDVIVENLLVGGMQRYGLSYEDLAPANARLIFCSITGFGQRGPANRRAAVDTAIQAASGLMSLSGTAQTGPMKAGFLMADYASGYAAALAIVSALYHRGITGEGQYIDVAMLETAMSLAGADFCEAAVMGDYARLRGNGDGRYVSNTFRCKEGTLAIAATTHPRRQKLWKALGREDIPQDPRFATPQAAHANYAAMHAEIETTLAAKTALEWEDIISAAGVAATAVRDLYQAMEHPQVKHRGYFHHFPHDPELGVALAVPTVSYKLSRTPAEVRTPPVKAGTHTNEVLRGLGYEETGIAELRRDGVV